MTTVAQPSGLLGLEVLAGSGRGVLGITPSRTKKHLQAGRCSAPIAAS